MSCHAGVEITIAAAHFCDDGPGGPRVTAGQTKGAFLPVGPMVVIQRSSLLLLLLAVVGSGQKPQHGLPSLLQASPLEVAPGGALLLAGGSVVVSSTFSEPGPVLHAFNLTVPPPGGWAVSVARQSDRTFFVVGKAPGFTVQRLYTATGRGRVLVNDTITANDGGDAIVGIQVRHRSWSATSSIEGVSGPDTLRASSCATYGITGELHHTPGWGTTVGLDAGTGGNPSVYGVFGRGASAVGVGMLALDDVFVAHSETANRAARQKDAFTGTPACLSIVSSPPSIELADPHFGLAAGDTHTLRVGHTRFGRDTQSSRGTQYLCATHVFAWHTISSLNT